MTVKHDDFTSEGIQSILSLYLFSLGARILLEKVCKLHEASTDSDQYLVPLFYFDEHAPRTIVVHAFAFSDEGYLQVLPIWEAVEETGKLDVRGVVFLGDVEGILLDLLVLAIHIDAIPLHLTDFEFRLREAYRPLFQLILCGL